MIKIFGHTCCGQKQFLEIRRVSLCLISIGANAYMNVLLDKLQQGRIFVGKYETESANFLLFET